MEGKGEEYRNAAAFMRVLSKCVFVPYLVLMCYVMFPMEYCELYRYMAYPDFVRQMTNLIPMKETVKCIELCMQGSYPAAALAKNIFIHLFIFIPWGFFLPYISKWGETLLHLSITVLAASLLFETGQLLMRCGSFDVDDVILHVVGGIIGFGLYRLCGDAGTKV